MYIREDWQHRHKNICINSTCARRDARKLWFPNEKSSWHLESRLLKILERVSSFPAIPASKLPQGVDSCEWCCVVCLSDEADNFKEMDIHRAVNIVDILLTIEYVYCVILYSILSGI